MIALMTHQVYQGDGAKQASLRQRETSLDVPLDALLAECAELRGGGKPPRAVHLTFLPGQEKFASLLVGFGNVQGHEQTVRVEFPFCYVPEMMAKVLAAGLGEAFGLVSLTLGNESGGGGKKRRITKRELATTEVVSMVL